MIEELYCDPKEEVIMACFLKNVTTNDLNDNLSQPKKTKVSKKKIKKNRTIERKQRHVSVAYKSIRTSEFFC